jgi:acyl carrier protein phosphodiesterase
MNFLAHLYLSGDDEEIITGNFIADHVKGRTFFGFNNGIRAGILLHRQIDLFTDSHPAFLESKKKLQVKYRKYAGVITDMFYDHFLASGWDKYSHENIDRFTNRMYSVVMKRYFILPPKTKRLLPFMAKDNWLKGYGTFEGLERALRGMDKRTPFESLMGEAVEDLRRDYGLYHSEFDRFFPEMIRFAEEKRKMLVAGQISNNIILPV